MTDIYRPERHVCPWLSGSMNGIWAYPSIRLRVERVEDGSVRLCADCGATWVAGQLPGLVPNVWRREGRVERWLRERRQRR